MYKIAYINPLTKVATSLFTEDQYEVTDVTVADAILIRSTKIHDMKLSPSVVAIGRAGVGVNTIPYERFAHEGVVVFNTPGANSNAVKEMTIAGMILAKRDLLGSIEWVKSMKDDPDIVEMVEKKKAKYAGYELQGKKLGVIGLGSIGGLVATEAVNLGMDVYGYDPFISVEHAWGLPKTVKNVNKLDRLFEVCDYITLHLPLTEDTKYLINEESFSKMKKGVILINYARDAIVNDQAVKKALEEGIVAKYLTDFPNPEVVNMPNTIVTPHLGGSTLESEETCAIMAVKEVKDYLERGNIRNSVNYPDCNAGSISGKVRLAINHRNIPNMLAQFTGIFGKMGANITKLVNNSRNDLAYTIFDLDTTVEEDIKKKLERIEGVLRVRLLYK